MAEYHRRSPIPAPARDVYDWHTRAGAFQRLLPPWRDVRLVDRTGGVEVGTTFEVEFRQGPFTARWIGDHVECEPGRSFTDVIVEGPMRSWRHLHAFEPDGADRSVMADHITYEPYGGSLIQPFIDLELDRWFGYRHEQLRRDIVRHRRVQGTATVAVTGASGLIGSHLVHFLTAGGYGVRRMLRQKGVPQWSESSLEGVDAVVHLAGEPFNSGPWTAARRRRIHESRVAGTRALCEMLANMADPPKVLISASAAFACGDQGDAHIDERTALARGYVGELVRDWEAATRPAIQRGIRVVHLRSGIVLSARGGLLPALLGPFRLGMGGPWGGGRQWVPWVALDDVVGAIQHLIAAEDAEGPIHVVAPNPVRNQDFAATLAAVLRRPALLPVPAGLIRRLLGDLGTMLLLQSIRAAPRKLLDTGFEFVSPDLETTLRMELGLHPPLVAPRIIQAPA